MIREINEFTAFNFIFNMLVAILFYRLKNQFSFKNKSYYNNYLIFYRIISRSVLICSRSLLGFSKIFLVYIIFNLVPLIPCRLISLIRHFN